MANNFYIASEILLSAFKEIFDEAEREANKKNPVGRRASYIRYLKYIKKDAKLSEKLLACRGETNSIFNTRQTKKTDELAIDSRMKSIPREAVMPNLYYENEEYKKDIDKRIDLSKIHSKSTLELSGTEIEHLIEIGTDPKDIQDFVNQATKSSSKSRGINNGFRGVLKTNTIELG